MENCLQPFVGIEWLMGEITMEILSIFFMVVAVRHVPTLVVLSILNFRKMNGTIFQQDQAVVAHQFFSSDADNQKKIILSTGRTTYIASALR
jgi:hypothetical protein